MSQNNKLFKKVNKKQLNDLLNSRETENLDLINLIDKYFIEKRGYVFKQPKPKEKVILLLSGGIDSTVAWATLIEAYDYKVYPVVIDRGTNKRAKKELAAVRKLESFFKEKYPDNYVKPFHLTVNTVAKEIIETVNPKKVTPEDILSNFNKNKHLTGDDSNVVIVRSKGVSPYLMPFYGVVYSDYLKFTKNLVIKNIFVGVNFTDGHEVSSQSFTSMRSTLLGICSATDDYDWNFSSVFLERETGVFLDKDATVALGLKLGVPLEKTWSCYNSKLFQCGDSCATCICRRGAFYNLGIEDKTIYMFDLKRKIIESLKFKIKKFFNLNKPYRHLVKTFLKKFF